MVPMWALVSLILIAETESKLQAYGCEDGYTHFKHFCYKLISMECNATRAQRVCNDNGAQIASVWSPREKKFLLSLWQHPSESIWLGLNVNSDGTWQWEDGSKLIVEQETGASWSILDDADPDLASPESGKCATLRPHGAITFPSCSMNGSGVACKYALRKVYALTGLLNQSSPAVSGALDHAQMFHFQRVLPPILSTLPSSALSTLGQQVVAVDTSCAFACYSQPSCQAFELSCRVADHCRSYLCVLLPGVAI